MRPDTQRFVEINPKYFYGIDDGEDGGLVSLLLVEFKFELLKRLFLYLQEITFRPEHNSVTVCSSRYSPEEIALKVSRWEGSKYEASEKTKS